MTERGRPPSRQLRAQPWDDAWIGSKADTAAADFSAWRAESIGARRGYHGIEDRDSHLAADYWILDQLVQRIDQWWGDTWRDEDEDDWAIVDQKMASMLRKARHDAEAHLPMDQGYEQPFTPDELKTLEWNMHMVLNDKLPNVEMAPKDRRDDVDDEEMLYVLARDWLGRKARGTNELEDWDPFAEYEYAEHELGWMQSRSGVREALDERRSDLYPSRLAPWDKGMQLDLDGDDPFGLGPAHSSASIHFDTPDLFDAEGRLDGGGRVGDEDDEGAAAQAARARPFKQMLSDAESNARNAGRWRFRASRDMLAAWASSYSESSPPLRRPRWGRVIAPGGLEGSRLFNGRTYVRAKREPGPKGEATRQAQNIRQLGFNARIVPMKGGWMVFGRTPDTPRRADERGRR